MISYSNWLLPILLLLLLSNVRAFQHPIHFIGRYASAPRKENVTRDSAVYSTHTPEFTGSFDANEMDELAHRGEYEANLMDNGAAGVQGVLEEQQQKKSKKKKSGRDKGPSAAMIARTLKQEGVVRLNSVLSPSTAATLREEILLLRTLAFRDINGGGDWRHFFADVLLKANRCDLLLSLDEVKPLQAALDEILTQGTLVNVLLSTIGEEATLYELATLISEPGAPRQPVHPDNPYQGHPPLLTCFIALQDINVHMGPTVFLPKTHKLAAHTQYDDHMGGQRDVLLQTQPNVAALLNVGDVALFDSRTMHCGGANDAEDGSTRVLLYFSFRNPQATQAIGNVGSLRSDVVPYTLRQLRETLCAFRTDNEKLD